MWKKILVPTLLCAAVACGDDSDDDDGKQPNETPLGECSADGSGTQLVLRGAFTRTSDDLSIVRNSRGGTIAFEGNNASGDDLWLGRDGDVGDGDLDEARSYDVSTYPYNFHYVEAPAGTDCEDSPAGRCSGFFALGGTYVVESVHPVYRATFTFTELADDDEGEPGADLAGTVTGCVAVSNP